jgi:acetolactate synthase-1/2/3 large subunit
MVDIGSPPLDFVRIAEGLGVPAVRVETVEGFVEHFARCLRERGPSVIEALL